MGAPFAEPIYGVELMEKLEIEQMVLNCLCEILREEGMLQGVALDESSVLIGHPSTLDSLTLVRLIITLERKIQTDYRISVTLADDRAMSQKYSPFRSVGTLTDYILLLVGGEEKGNG
jgi:hypothetical protein